MIFNSPKAFAKQNNVGANCVINNSLIVCYNISSTQIFKVNLFSEPYRIRINFKNNLIIKKHKDHNYAFTLHINEIPYNIDIYMLKERVSYFLKRINCEKKFSHLCCNLKGVVFEDKKNNLDFIRHKNWFRVI